MGTAGVTVGTGGWHWRREGGRGGSGTGSTPGGWQRGQGHGGDNGDTGRWQRGQLPNPKSPRITPNNPKQPQMPKCQLSPIAGSRRCPRAALGWHRRCRGRRGAPAAKSWGKTRNFGIGISRDWSEISRDSEAWESQNPGWNWGTAAISALPAEIPGYSRRNSQFSTPAQREFPGKGNPGRRTKRRIPGMIPNFGRTWDFWEYF